jgi:hypothetical protein
MDSDDGEECEDDCVFVIQVDLIHRLTMTMLDTLDRWHDERGIIEIELPHCAAALMAATNAAVEMMGHLPKEKSTCH